VDAAIFPHWNNHIDVSVRYSDNSDEVDLRIPCNRQRVPITFNQLIGENGGQSRNLTVLS